MAGHVEEGIHGSRRGGVHRQDRCPSQTHRGVYARHIWGKEAAQDVILERADHLSSSRKYNLYYSLCSFHTNITCNVAERKSTSVEMGYRRDQGSALRSHGTITARKRAVSLRAYASCALWSGNRSTKHLIFLACANARQSSVSLGDPAGQPRMERRFTSNDTAKYESHQH